MPPWCGVSDLDPANGASLGRHVIYAHTGQFAPIDQSLGHPPLDQPYGRGNEQN